jgi:hypothetical protein
MYDGRATLMLLTFKAVTTNVPLMLSRRERVAASVGFGL